MFTGGYRFFGAEFCRVQCEAPKIAKLVHITPMSLWFMVLITIVTGANLNQLVTGGASHCRSGRYIKKDVWFCFPKNLRIDLGDP